MSARTEHTVDQRIAIPQHEYESPYPVVGVRTILQALCVETTTVSTRMCRVLSTLTGYMRAKYNAKMFASQS